MLATVAPGAHVPIAGVLASWSHATIPNEFPKPAWDGLWWTTVTPRTPGVEWSSASTWPGTEGTCAARKSPACSYSAARHPAWGASPYADPMRDGPRQRPT